MRNNTVTFQNTVRDTMYVFSKEDIRNEIKSWLKINELVNFI